MSWKKVEEFPLEIKLKKCKKCGTAFEEEWSGSDMYMNFIRLMKCVDCGEMRYVSTYDDKIYEAMADRAKKELGLIKITTNEEDNKFSEKLDELFEKTCELCKCGGRFIFDYKNYCPNCKTRGKENFEKIKVSHVDRKIKVVKHIENIDIQKE